MIKYVEVKEREGLLPQLLRVWESAVRATHLFLSEKEVEKNKGIRAAGDRGSALSLPSKRACPWRLQA